MQQAMQNLIDEVQPAPARSMPSYEELTEFARGVPHRPGATGALLDRDGFIQHHPLFARVRNEIDGWADLSDEALAHVIEATVFQLRRMATEEAVIDLDYLGELHRVEDVVCERGDSERRTWLAWLGGVFS